MNGIVSLGGKDLDKYHVFSHVEWSAREGRHQEEAVG